MAQPFFLGAGAGAFSLTSPVTVTKTGCKAGNLVIITCMVLPGVGSSPSFSSAVSNITSLGGVANTLNQFASGGSFELAATAGRVGVRFGRVTADGTVSVDVTNSGGLDGFARIYEFANVDATGTTPEAICENSGLGLPDQSAATSATVAAALVTSTGADRLAVSLISMDDDLTIGSFTGETFADWTEALAEYSTASGEQGTLQLQTAPMPTAGSITGGSVVASGSSNYSVLAFALLPDTEPNFPTLGILDAANRTNASPLDAPWTGPLFTGENQLRLVSNQIEPIPTEGNSYLSTPYGPDIEAYCTLTSSIDSGERVIFYFRSTVGVVNGYRVQFRNIAADHLIIVDRMDADVNTQLGGNIDPADTFAALDKFGCSMYGDTIRTYYRPTTVGGWILQGKRTDSTYTGMGFTGMSLVGTVTVDDVGGGTIASAPTTSIAIPRAIAYSGWR